MLVRRFLWFAHNANTHTAVSDGVNPNLNSDNDEALIGGTVQANRTEPDGDTVLLFM